MLNITNITHKRVALTLLEVLVAIGIVAILLALLLPVVQKIRLSASVMREKNKVKQIALALHMWDESHGGRVGGGGVFESILPYLSSIPPEQLENRNYDYKVRPYINNDDPATIQGVSGHSVSYVYNKLIHPNRFSTRTKVLRDGASNTIEITTHYRMIEKKINSITYSYQQFIVLSDSFSFSVPHPEDSTYVLVLRGATFANPYYGDVLPGSPEAQSLTFQLRPKSGEGNPRIPQSPYTHGLLAGLADGSVRMISPQISPQTFWAAVSPNGGEVLGPDW